MSARRLSLPASGAVGIIVDPPLGLSPRGLSYCPAFILPSFDRLPSYLGWSVAGAVVDIEARNGGLAGYRVFQIRV